MKQQAYLPAAYRKQPYYPKHLKPSVEKMETGLPSTNAGDLGSIPGLGRSHVLSN